MFLKIEPSKITHFQPQFFRLPFPHKTAYAYFKLRPLAIPKWDVSVCHHGEVASRQTLVHYCPFPKIYKIFLENLISKQFPKISMLRKVLISHHSMNFYEIHITLARCLNSEGRWFCNLPSIFLLASYHSLSLLHIIITQSNKRGK